MSGFKAASKEDKLTKENKEDTDEIRKIAIKIMYISTAGAAKGTD